jgi:hypothetical protein
MCHGVQRFRNPLLNMLFSVLCKCDLAHTCDGRRDSGARPASELQDLGVGVDQTQMADGLNATQIH